MADQNMATPPTPAHTSQYQRFDTVGAVVGFAKGEWLFKGFTGEGGVEVGDDVEWRRFGDLPRWGGGFAAAAAAVFRVDIQAMKLTDNQLTGITSQSSQVY
jgi:hypothetical protein